MQTSTAAESLLDSSAFAPLLDIYSTSPTDLPQNEVQVKQGLVLCTYKSPYFAIPLSNGFKAFEVRQGCCNHWTCPKHGIVIARSNYGRIVEGCSQIAKESELWFTTITCLGKEIAEQEAFKNYGGWTSKFLDACYTKAKRSGKRWDYVQVTEKQKRGHPHSHMIGTFAPDDLYEGTVDKWEMNNEGRRVHTKVPALRSNWIEAQLARSGLGSQYDISKVRSLEAAARYIGKYMFKETQFTTQYPKNWHRVRYSGNFPQLPEQEPTDAFVLLNSDDWRRLAREAVVITTHEREVTEYARAHLKGSDVLISERLKTSEDDRY